MRRILVTSARCVALLAIGAAAAGAQSLTGLYLQNQSLGRGNVWHYYYFWPDGRMCNAMPKGGMNPAPAYATVAAQAPGQCGTFALDGKQLKLQTDGSGRSVSLAVDHVDQSGFALSGFPTIRVPAFRDGATLDGSWKTLIIERDDYRNQSFTFHPDGSFAYDDVPVRASGAPARHTTGTYRISGHTLKVTSGGATQTMSIHGFPDDPRISIDGNVLDKR